MTRGQLVVRQLRENAFVAFVVTLWCVGVATVDVVFGVVTWILLFAVFVVGYASGRLDEIRDPEDPA